MIGPIFGAAIRAFIVIVVIYFPTMLLPSASSDAKQIATLFAALAGSFTFAEYYSTYPSIVAFRDAPPFNRYRIFSFALLLYVTGKLIATFSINSTLGGALLSMAIIADSAMGFAYSPSTLIASALPAGTSSEVISFVRYTASFVLLLTLLLALFYAAIVRILDWPYRIGAFNVWVNLPLFDPTSGDDVLRRLRIIALSNVAMAILLPFAMPGAFYFLRGFSEPTWMTHQHALTWVIAIWAFLPLSLIMRGIALARIIEMISEKRRRTYAQMQSVQAAWE